MMIIGSVCRKCWVADVDGMMMMMITAFGARNVPAATTKIKQTITEIKNDQKRSKTRITVNAFDGKVDGKV